jgi:DNA-binding transcriptional MocR family regulator
MITVDLTSSVPLVTQIFEAFATKIDKGVLRGGVRLPSVRKLAVLCSVSTLTVSNAYNRLVAEGYLEARRASGYFVRSRPRRHERPRPAMPVEASIDSLWLLQRMYEEESSLLKAGCGWLPESHLFTEGIKQALSVLAKKPNAAVARYGHPLGYAPLRQQIQISLAQRNIECDPDQIVLTHGASQALELTARSLLRPGDFAFVDDPGYCNLFPVLQALGVRIAGIERTLHGPNADILQALAERHRPKAFFTNSNLHNPTGTSCSPATAYRILRLADQFDFHIVEDDIFASLVHDPVQSIASLDQLQRVIYIGSFSKTISPSLRAGFLACGQELARRILSLKMASGLTSSELTEQLVYSILVEGQHRLHLARLREKLASAQKSVGDELASAGLSIFHRPAAGMFLWAGFGKQLDVRLVAQKAFAEGIMLAPGHLFRPDQTSTPWLRFNVTHANSPRLYRFLESVSKSEAMPIPV